MLSCPLERLITRAMSNAASEVSLKQSSLPALSTAQYILATLFAALGTILSILNLALPIYKLEKLLPSNSRPRPAPPVKPVLALVEATPTLPSALPPPMERNPSQTSSSADSDDSSITLVDISSSPPSSPSATPPKSPAGSLTSPSKKCPSLLRPFRISKRSSSARHMVRHYSTPPPVIDPVELVLDDATPTTPTRRSFEVIRPRSKSHGGVDCSGASNLTLDHFPPAVRRRR